LLTELSTWHYVQEERRFHIYMSRFSKEISISNEVRGYENRKTRNPGANVTKR